MPTYYTRIMYFKILDLWYTLQSYLSSFNLNPCKKNYEKK